MSAQTITRYIVQQRKRDETWTDSNPGYDKLDQARQHVRDWLQSWEHVQGLFDGRHVDAIVRRSSHDSGQIRIIGRFITTFEIAIE